MTAFCWKRLGSVHWHLIARSTSSTTASKEGKVPVSSLENTLKVILTCVIVSHFWELLTWVPPTKTSKAVGCGDLRIHIRGGAVCTILIDLIDRTLLHKQYSINQVIVLMHFFVRWLSSVDLLNCCVLADLVPFGEGVPTQKLLGHDLTCSHGGFPLVIFLCLVVVVVVVDIVLLLAAAVHLTFHS